LPKLVCQPFRRTHRVRPAHGFAGKIRGRVARPTGGDSAGEIGHSRNGVGNIVEGTGSGGAREEAAIGVRRRVPLSGRGRAGLS